MKKNKLISLLRTFSENDFFHFRKYLISPFFNEREDLVRLYDLLREHDLLKGQTDNEEGKLGLWKNLYPRKKYNDTKLRRLFSDLLRLAMDFLAYQQYQHNPALSRVMLLHALSGSPLEKHFAGTVRQTKKELEKSGFLDADYHYMSYLLQRRQHEQLEHISQKRTAFDFLEKADYHLDCYYLSRKLEHFSDTLGYRDMTSNSADIHLLPGLLAHLESSKFRKEPAIQCWYLVIQMLQNREEETYFFQLKKLLGEQGHLFQKRTSKALLIHLMNYCIYSKIHNNRPEYNRELFSLYKIGLEKKIVFDGKELGLTHYKNVIAISMHLGEFDWAEGFIQDYTSFLPEKDRENALNYNLAKVYFHQGEHGKVIEQLREVEYQNVEYAIGSRLMLLQTYYELEEFEPLEFLIDSFKIYLRRNKLITTATKQRCFNLLRFTFKLSTLAPYDEKGREKLKGQIEKCKALAAKGWLLEKLAA